MSSTEQLMIEANRVRESGVLGDARLRQLFDYLLDRTIARESPKELVIAMDVFGKGADFSVGEDALVRVYVHKLRKALSSFYSSAGTNGGYSLQLPKGDYRLHLQPPGDPPTPSLEREVTPQGLTDRVGFWQLACAISSLVAIALLVYVGYEHENHDELAGVRKSPVWADLLADGRPITIAVGDYYLLGETDDSNEVKRLIREFDINSRTDLDRYLMQHPGDRRHLVDVGFNYLPTSSAGALRHVMAVLAPAERRITVRMASDLPVSALKSTNVIYIGFVSAMGMLQDPVFEHSRLSVGSSYDELVDAKTGKIYVSQEVSQVHSDDNATEKRSAYNDYGLFAKLRGPAGNVLMIVAGTRDEGVEEASEELTNQSTLKSITSQLDASKPFEGLLEVSALGGVDMSGRLIFIAPRTAIDVTPQRNQSASPSR